MADKDTGVRFVREERADGTTIWKGELTIQITLDEDSLVELGENYHGFEETIGDLLTEAGEEIMLAIEEAGAKVDKKPANYKELN